MNIHPEKDLTLEKTLGLKHCWKKASN